jgi:hypothetical protein
MQAARVSPLTWVRRPTGRVDRRTSAVWTAHRYPVSRWGAEESICALAFATLGRQGEHRFLRPMLMPCSLREADPLEDSTVR